MLIPLLLLYHPPPSSKLLPSPCILSSLPSPPPYSLPSPFSSLPHFDPSLHPSPCPAGSAGTEAAFVSSVSSILWRRRAEKQEAGRDGQKTWRETETKIEMGKWDKKTRTVRRQIKKGRRLKKEGFLWINCQGCSSHWYLVGTAWEGRFPLCGGFSLKDVCSQLSTLPLGSVLHSCALAFVERPTSQSIDNKADFRHSQCTFAELPAKSSPQTHEHNFLLLEGNRESYSHCQRVYFCSKILFDSNVE